MFSQQLKQWEWTFNILIHCEMGLNIAKFYHSSIRKICSKRFLPLRKLIVRNWHTTFSKSYLPKCLAKAQKCPIWTCKFTASCYKPMSSLTGGKQDMFPPRVSLKSSQALPLPTKPLAVFAEPYKYSKYHLKMFEISDLPRSFPSAWTYKQTTESYSKEIN